MTDTTTPAGLAGTGPWHAVLAWRDGYLITDLDNIDEPGDCSIGIVRGSALPRDDGDGSLRLPGSHPYGDSLLEVDGYGDSLLEVDGYGDSLLEVDGEDLDSCDELLERWQQVQAMVDGLNRAAQAASL